MNALDDELRWQASRYFGPTRGRTWLHLILPPLLGLVPFVVLVVAVIWSPAGG